MAATVPVTPEITPAPNSTRAGRVKPRRPHRHGDAEQHQQPDRDVQEQHRQRRHGQGAATVPGTRPANAVEHAVHVGVAALAQQRGDRQRQARDEQRARHERRVEQGEQRRRGEGEAEADRPLHARRDGGEQGRHGKQQHPGSIVPPWKQSAA